MSDAIKGDDMSKFGNFQSLQYSMYMMCFVAVLGGVFFLANSWFIVKDKAKAIRYVKGEAILRCIISKGSYGARVL
jgi:hypothetical protein